MTRAAFATFLLCVLLQSAAEAPELSARDVVNAADQSTGRVAPGEIVVLFSQHAGPDVMIGAQANDGRNVPTLLGETRVLFDGIAAPMVYSVRGQAGAVVPYEIAGRATTEVVVEYRGVRSAAVTLPVVASAPALFTLDSSGHGQAAMLNETGCCNSVRNPAARGSIAVLYATGEGQTSPHGVTGRVSAFDRTADYPSPRLPVRVTVGGEAAEIIFAGEAPHAVAGLLQVNFRVPKNSPLGDAVPLVLTVGDSRSPDGVTMAVRSAVHRVVVMESDPAARAWFRRVLTQAGYEVLVARNGADAFAQAKRHPVDLVIAGLPGSEKVGTIDALRAERPQVKVVGTAASLDAATLRAADLLGAQAVFTKPVRSQAVLKRVRELLRSRPTPYVADENAPTLFPLLRSAPR
jgi:uncharacterized protein (TIGR03437 family)